MINAEFVYQTDPAFIIFIGAIIPYFPVISTKSYSRTVKKSVREFFLCSNSSGILGTFWCKYAVQMSRLKEEAEGFEPENAVRRINIWPAFLLKSRLKWISYIS